MPIHLPHSCQKKALLPNGKPWYSEFPEPVSTPSTISPAEVLSLLLRARPEPAAAAQLKGEKLSFQAAGGEREQVLVEGLDREPSPPPSPSSSSSSDLSSSLATAGLGYGNNNNNKNYLIIDTRRTDFLGGTIKGAINIPAHSFWYSRKTIYDLCRGSWGGEGGRVVFYCGSSKGRGPRCAGWMQDYINELNSALPGDRDIEIKAEVLTGGIRGWVKLYGGEMMEGYDEEHWIGGKEDEV